MSTAAEERFDSSTTRLLAAGLAVIGVAGVGGGVAATETTLLDATLGPVLVAVGVLCLAAGLLTWAFVPHRPVPAETARGVYRALAANQDAVMTSFDLSKKPVYVPTGRDPEETPIDAVRALYLSDDHTAPATIDPDVTVLGSKPISRGIALRPTAGPFLGALYHDLPNGPSDDLEVLAAQLADAAVESFELAASVRVQSVEDDTLSFRVKKNTFGQTGSDSPVGSLLASALALERNQPVALQTTGGQTRTETTVTLRLREPAGAREATETAVADSATETGA